MCRTSILVNYGLMSLSDNVKRIRRDRGMSQGALAAKAGLSQQLISQIERGVNRSMTADNLASLARALGVQVTELAPNLESVLFGDAAAIGQRILNLSDKRKTRMLETLLDLEAAETTVPAKEETPTGQQGSSA